ncbi:GHKL domain-containing protein [Paenibacillus sp. FSL K6-1230]|uniref:GHKL domain-containing protein n=1 Tax=Paenibacillus sp. FSL K6-1230 TaxID=2921603 RepID=UPI000399C24A
MNGYYLLLHLCVALVMCFQLNLYYDSVFGKAARKPTRFIYCAIFVLLDMLYLQIDLPSIVASLMALIVIFSLSGAYRVEMKLKVLFSILYSVLITLVHMGTLYVLYPAMDMKYSSYPDFQGQYVLLTSGITLLLSCIIMFAVIGIIRWMARRRSLPLHNRYYLLFLSVPLISIFQVNVLSSNSEKNVYYLISVCGLLFLNVMIVYLFDNIIEKFQLLHENDQLQQQMDYQDANYEKTVHSFKNIKRIIHDTNQHFLYIEECLKRNQPAEAQAHIRTTLHKIEDAYQRVNTGNLVIDALVTNTLQIGQANGIRIDTRLHLHEHELPIERYDLCVVLGNMLDNAIEASKRIRLAEDRHMVIKIHSTTSALMIHIRNQMEQPAPDLISQKPDTEFHGIGLTNIARICEHYGGNMTIESEQRTFNNMVFIPFP